MHLNSIPHWLDKVGVLWECVQQRQLFCIAALKSVLFDSGCFISHHQLNQQMSIKMSKSCLHIPVSVIRTRLNLECKTVKMLSIPNFCVELEWTLNESNVAVNGILSILSVISLPWHLSQGLIHVLTCVLTSHQSGIGCILGACRKSALNTTHVKTYVRPIKFNYSKCSCSSFSCYSRTCWNNHLSVSLYYINTHMVLLASDVNNNPWNLLGQLAWFIWNNQGLSLWTCTNV